MTKYRQSLPQLSGAKFLTDAGLETVLVYRQGIDLPCFAAFDLLKNDTGVEVLRQYFRAHAAIAADNGCGFILESATWRASADWAEKLGHSLSALRTLNRASIDLLGEVRREFSSRQTPMVISGCVGPRGDGYDACGHMDDVEAERYHRDQIETFATTDADMVTAITMTNVDEAIGVARAARAAGMPSVISFTVETNARLPSGDTLSDAIERVDAATEAAPEYYMINCAHPTHFARALHTGERWVQRIRGLRVNASRKSHAELDQATELDDGNPAELAAQCAELRGLLPHINVLGGCCGTDERHIAEIAKEMMAD
jgi:S-methylmethionine-dependent homocysteine/selenocysteine methylase